MSSTRYSAFRYHDRLAHKHGCYVHNIAHASGTEATANTALSHGSPRGGDERFARAVGTTHGSVAHSDTTNMGWALVVQRREVRDMKCKSKGMFDMDWYIVSCS